MRVYGQFFLLQDNKNGYFVVIKMGEYFIKIDIPLVCYDKMEIKLPETEIGLNLQLAKEILNL